MGYSNCSPCDPCGTDQNAAKAAAYARMANTYATNAENSWLEFNALYLGAFSVAPTTDNEGNPLQEGALYFNSVSNQMFVWQGGSWIDFDFDEFTPFLATGTTTARNLVTRMADVVNVKDFGAVGDGVTDDGPSIRLAAAQAFSTQKTLYFPSGNYNIATDNMGNSISVGSNFTYLIRFNNTSTTLPKKINIIGDNAIISTPLNANNNGGFNVIEIRGWFDDVQIQGIYFKNTCFDGSNPALQVIPKGRRFGIMFFPYDMSYPPTGGSLQLKTVPTNVIIENCIFEDFKQGINFWSSKNVKVSKCSFLYTYGIFSGGEEPTGEWTVGIGVRSLNGGIFTDNYFNGFTADSLMVNSYLYSVNDIKPADGFILTSAYLPIGPINIIISNNIVYNFSREGINSNNTKIQDFPPFLQESNPIKNVTSYVITGNYVNGQRPSFLSSGSSSTNWGIAAFNNFCNISSNIVENCDIGIWLITVGTSGSPAVIVNSGPHYSNISNNQIILNGYNAANSDRAYSYGIEVQGHNIYINNNSITGFNLGSFNDGWNGNINDTSTNYNFLPSTGISIFGSFTGAYQQGDYPSIHIKNNNLSCYNKNAGSFNSAFFVSGGDGYFYFEENKIYGWDFVWTKAGSATSSISVANNNQTDGIIREFARNNANSFQIYQPFNLFAHTFKVYPTSTGWYLLNFFQRRNFSGTIKFLTMTDISEDFAEHWQNTVFEISANAINNLGIQNWNINQISSYKNDSPIVSKLYISNSSQNQSRMWFNVQNLIDRIPLKFSSGNASGYANIVNGVINSITLTNAGTGYSSAPTVSLDQGIILSQKIIGSGCVLSAALAGGGAISVSIVNGGSGYAWPLLIRWDSSVSDFPQNWKGGLFEIRKADGLVPQPGTTNNTGFEYTILKGSHSLLIDNDFNTGIVGSGNAITRTSNPTGSLIPTYVGQQVIDTTNKIVYVATGITNTDWRALN